MNFLRKNWWAYVSIFSRSGARRFERLICSKYYIVLKRTFPFLCLNFKHMNLWSPLAPLEGGIDICAQWLFCKEFNTNKLLFEWFFDVYFWQCSTKSESTFPLLHIITFESIKILSPPAPLLGEICVPTDFCVRDSILNNFYLNNFLIYSVILRQCSAWRWIYFPILVQYNIIFETLIFRAPYLHSWEG